KFRKKPTKEMVAANMKSMELDEKEGIKFHGIYWTLGRYDVIGIYEAPNEKVAMKSQLRRSDAIAAETLVAVPVEEARKLVE
ncbi:MAG: GYD domain-containing protein, partial [Methanomicrobiales archaeon]|nr:GYD domain-containing protein [Methanomicrobiales archaeon]